MHKIRVRRAKQKLQVVEEVGSKIKISPVAKPAMIVPAQKEKQDAGKKQVLDATPIIEVMPVTKARDITPLIRPTPPAEVEAESQAEPSVRALEPRVREVTTPTPAEARPYETSRTTEYRASSAAYTSVSQQASEGQEYRAGSAQEPSRPLRLQTLQPPWRDEHRREERNFPQDPRLEAEHRDRYEARQYELPEERDRALGKRKKQPWE